MATHRSNPSAVDRVAPARSVTASPSRPVRRCPRYSAQDSISDHDLSDGQELLLGHGTLIAPALRHAGGRDTARERNEGCRLAETRRHTAEREVGIPAADR